MTSYADSTAFKHYASIPVSSTDYDAEITLALESASRLIEQFCGRTFDAPGVSPTVKYASAYWLTDWRQWAVAVPDLADTDDLEIDVDVNGDGTYAESVDVSKIVLLPANGAAPYRRIVLPSSASATNRPSAVRVTGHFGYPDGAPETVQQACLLQANRFFNRRNSPYGISGSPDAGFGELRLLSQVDPDVRLMLQPYVVLWGAR